MAEEVKAREASAICPSRSAGPPSTQSPSGNMMLVVGAREEVQAAGGTTICPVLGLSVLPPR